MRASFFCNNYNCSKQGPVCFQNNRSAVGLHLFRLVHDAECLIFVGLQRVMEFSDLRSVLHHLVFKLCVTYYTNHVCCFQVCGNLWGLLKNGLTQPWIRSTMDKTASLSLFIVDD